MCYYIHTNVISWCVGTKTRPLTTSTKSWTSSDRSTQHTPVTVYTTFTTVGEPKKERTTGMDGNRDSDPTMTRDTSSLTHVTSGSQYNTETIPSLIRTPMIADVTTQEAPSPIIKEPKHGRLFRDIT